jgi:hypothetical protein
MMDEPLRLGDAERTGHPLLFGHTFFYGLLSVAGILLWVWAWHKLGLVRLTQISLKAQISGVKLAVMVLLAAATILIVTVLVARLLRPRGVSASECDEEPRS